MNKEWHGQAVSKKYLTVLLNGPHPKFPRDVVFSNLEGGGSNKMQPYAKLMRYLHEGPCSGSQFLRVQKALSGESRGRQQALMRLKELWRRKREGHTLGIEQRHKNTSSSDATSCDLQALVEDPK